ncbi:CG13869 [Drosophila busckii]|uniref:CG13869 n=1 Tax=Drosophila busckii TaxID=30019 RepID=A0A0M4EJD9_DROBS|nr:uncharacterized protein LOC108595174 [Drosophila busckii]ALC41367.1 CG13869 [Drosophila busckii]
MNLCVVLIGLLQLQAVLGSAANLTAWRQQRRQKRFLIFENGGIVKAVTGVSLPVDFMEINAWRQLVWLMNFHYQFAEPTTPIYWWKLWSGRELKGPLKLNKKQVQPAPESFVLESEVDVPQLMLYEFAVQYMNQLGQRGSDCLQRLICENAQVHEHSGLYAQLLHRLLSPHKSLSTHYLDAYDMGTHGIDCRHAYPAAQPCFLDKYIHVHVQGATQSYT